MHTMGKDENSKTNDAYDIKSWATFKVLKSLEEAYKVVFGRPWTIHKGLYMSMSMCTNM